MGMCQVCGAQKVSKWRWVHLRVQGGGLSRRCPHGGNSKQRTGLGLSTPSEWGEQRRAWGPAPGATQQGAEGEQ